jgi:hypothetical protein
MPAAMRRARDRQPEHSAVPALSCPPAAANHMSSVGLAEVRRFGAIGRWHSPQFFVDSLSHSVGHVSSGFSPLNVPITPASHSLFPPIRQDHGPDDYPRHERADTRRHSAGQHLYAEHHRQRFEPEEHDRSEHERVHVTQRILAHDLCPP